MSFAALARNCASRTSAMRSLTVHTSSRQPTVAAAAVRRGGGGQRRNMGGAVDRPISQSMEAELFQGHSKEPEGWESTIYLTYAASSV